jgi:hypothetical protein
MVFRVTPVPNVESEQTKKQFITSLFLQTIESLLVPIGASVIEQRELQAIWLFRKQKVSWPSMVLA